MRGRPLAPDNEIVGRQSRGRSTRRSSRFRLHATEVDRRLHRAGEPAPATARRPAGSAPGPCEPGACAAPAPVPTRASWVGKTPRVSSRSASSAAFVLADQRVQTGLGPLGNRRSRRSQLARERDQPRAARRGRSPPPARGGRRRRPRRSGPGTAPARRWSGRAPRPGRPARASIADVAERDRGLVGQRRQQPLVGRAQRPRSGARRPGCVPSTVPSVPHRTTWATAAPDGLPAPGRGRDVGAVPPLSVAPRVAPRRPGRPRRRRRGAGRRTGRLREPVAEVRERLVGRGARAVGQPVGEPDHRCGAAAGRRARRAPSRAGRARIARRACRPSVRPARPRVV